MPENPRAWRKSVPWRISVAEGSGDSRYALISSRCAFFISAMSGSVKIRTREKNDGERHAAVGDSRARSSSVHRNDSIGTPSPRSFPSHDLARSPARPAPSP